ncbi:hypothetical protein M430DRAFT_167961 [Amorphotheca resinae ATCC 22711]|uniref:Uncharacterized protein n=1 Tax=Amorphotheca resinae ATCC 22711 TaxID=857342 RepID=A0A2T3AU53_AMORE|nr:hypothetical protein M430DRAFT_167961 [Amorphotheca resinae ATCC 22711]PSS12197.1 hypothetical protein M430DRAFT_167961 [Amorphotheca resinae ATCC 22711]
MYLTIYSPYPASVLLLARASDSSLSRVYISKKRMTSVAQREAVRPRNSRKPRSIPGRRVFGGLVSSCLQSFSFPSASLLDQPNTSHKHTPSIHPSHPIVEAKKAFSLPLPLPLLLLLPSLPSFPPLFFLSSPLLFHPSPPLNSPPRCLPMAMAAVCLAFCS